MEMINSTLTRRPEEIERAIYVVKKRLIRSDLPKDEDIELFLELLTIKDCLEELLYYKNMGVSFLCNKSSK